MQDRVSIALSEFEAAPHRLQLCSTTVARLQGIAGVRYGLAVTADAVGGILSAGGKTTSDVLESHHSLSSHSRPSASLTGKLLSKAKDVCSTVRDPHLELFLLKQLVRSHGMDVVQKMEADPGLRWICAVTRQGEEVEMANSVVITCTLHILLQKEPVVPDFTVVLQSPYLELRGAVAKTVMSNDTRHLEAVLKVLSDA